MSAPDNTKGTLFKDKLNAKAIKYRDCKPEDLVITDCLARIKEEIKNDESVVLIGSSLGGYLAAKTALGNKNVKQIILLNPAIIPLSVDISKIDGMPQKILSDIQDISLFKNKISSDVYILIGLHDEVVPIKWPLEFAMSQNSTIKFIDDDHRFTKKLNKLPQIIDMILYKNIK
jgi:predicted esterase YcpF (UPF0227 family)